MLNGPTVEGKVRAGVIKGMLDAKKTPEQVIEALYIRSLTRKPSARELQRLMPIVKEAPNPQAGLEDIFWALLNSREFMFNH